MTSLRQKKLFLLDMDGTLYLGDRLFEGTPDFLRQVRAQGARAVFLTNNSSRGVQDYVLRMQSFGIDAAAGDFLTSADATVCYLKKHEPNGVFYVCGTESLKKQLRDAGLCIRETLCGDITTLLLGYDTELTYRRLEDCCILLGRGVGYIATHPDLVCPTSYGYAPDCGSIIEMLDTACRRRPTVIGKPQPEMALLAMQRFGVSPEQTCLIGDRIYTDVACGKNAGIDTVFLLSGEGVVSDCEKYGVRPTWILPDIRAVWREMTRA